MDGMAQDQGTAIGDRCISIWDKTSRVPRQKTVLILPFEVVYFLMLCHPGTLLILETVPCPELANS